MLDSRIDRVAGQHPAVIATFAYNLALHDVMVEYKDEEKKEVSVQTLLNTLGWLKTPFPDNVKPVDPEKAKDAKRFALLLEQPSKTWFELAKLTPEQIRERLKV